MRQTGLQGSGVQTFSKASLRGLRLAAIVLATGLVMSSHTVRADDDDDEPEKSVMDNLMSGIGARPAGDTGIKYRERSPLVVPSKIALPPPADGKKNNAPNWPKDPDEAARKEAIEAAKKTSTSEEIEKSYRPLLPSELATKSTRKRSPSPDDATPGAPNNRSLSPSELGYKGGLFSNMFNGNKAEDTQFKGEPTRESLSQPPVGYQTPSPKYKYGTGPADAIDTEYNPAAGKYGGR